VIVEWRALTLALLDETYKRLLEALGTSAAEFPMVKVRKLYTFGVCINLVV